MDIYAEITNKIVAKMQDGIIPWDRPWCGCRWAVNYKTGRVYSLLNQFLLDTPGEYATFKQVAEAGGHVKKGAKSKFVVFWKLLAKKQADGAALTSEDDDRSGEKIPLLRYFNVFNISTDCEGLKPKHQGELRDDFKPIEKVEEIIEAYAKRSGLLIEHVAQGRSYYSPADDRVVLPLREQFKDDASYYSAAFHELVHSTGSKERLDRFGDKHVQRGGEDYSKEELVAEIGAASILNILGIETPRTFDNSAAYIQNWIERLQNDKKLIVSASGRAEKAVNLILGEVA